MDSYVYKYATRNLSKLFGQLWAGDGAKIEVIDPICTLFKLSSLEYKPTKTRLSLYEHKLGIQDPGLQQTITRWWWEEDRTNLYQLHYPLAYFIGLKHGFIENKFKQNDLNLLSQHVRKGIEQLKKTYETTKKTGSLVRTCLDTYMSDLNKDWTREEYDDMVAKMNKPTLFVIYNEFIKIWNSQGLKIGLSLINLAEKMKSENVGELSLNALADSIINYTKAYDIQIDLLRPV